MINFNNYAKPIEQEVRMTLRNRSLMLRPEALYYKSTITSNTINDDMSLKDLMIADIIGMAESSNMHIFETLLHVSDSIKKLKDSVYLANYFLSLYRRSIPLIFEDKNISM